MARRGWGGSTAAALGVAAGAGAAQLGFGYGLGIINWAPTGTVRVESAWVASLAWATWIAATSVVVGAVCAQRLRGGDEPVGTLPRLGLALAAGVGALVTVLLVAVPARAARVPDTTAPQTVAAVYATAGLVLGVLLATWALHTRAAATNLIATTGWLWLLAVVSVVDGVLSGRGLATAQLGIWQISADSARFWIRDYFYWPGALLSLGSALLIGVLAARRAARSSQGRVGATASGAAGPLLVALAYLLAVPRLAGIAAEQLSAHLIAPYAVIAGVGGSVLVTALAQRADRRVADRAPAAVPDHHGEEPEPAGEEPVADGQPAGKATKPAGRFFRRRAGSDTAPSVGDRPGDGPGAPDRAGTTDVAASAGTRPDGRRTPTEASGPARATGLGSGAAPGSDREKLTGSDREATPGSGRDGAGSGRDAVAGSGRDAVGAEEQGATAGRTGRAAGGQAGSAGGAARTTAARRSRAVPQQRQPEDAPPATTAGRAGVDEPEAGDGTVTPPSPATEPKARRRTR